MTLTTTLFSILAVVAIGSALSTVLSKNPVASAMSLILHFFSLAGLYLTLNAQFLAAIQILVYAGAIMVLVVFVVMLLNLGKESALKEQFNQRTALAIAMGSVIVLQISAVFLKSPTGVNQLSEQSEINGSVESIGTSLFTDYLFPFEAISLLLLVAVVGSVVLAKREKKNTIEEGA